MLRADGDRARQDGLIHGFLQKPCDRREVQATVRAAVALVLAVREAFRSAGAQRLPAPPARDTGG